MAIISLSPKSPVSWTMLKSERFIVQAKVTTRKQKVLGAPSHSKPRSLHEEPCQGKCAVGLGYGSVDKVCHKNMRTRVQIDPPITSKSQVASCNPST